MKSCMLLLMCTPAAYRGLQHTGLAADVYTLLLQDQANAAAVAAAKLLLHIFRHVQVAMVKAFAPDLVAEMLTAADSIGASSITKAKV